MLNFLKTPRSIFARFTKNTNGWEKFLNGKFADCSKKLVEFSRTFGKSIEKIMNMHLTERSTPAPKSEGVCAKCIREITGEIRDHV